MTDDEISDLWRRAATSVAPGQSDVNWFARAIADAEHEAAMAAILEGCPSDGSDMEIVLRRAWDRVRTMRSNV